MPLALSLLCLCLPAQDELAPASRQAASRPASRPAADGSAAENQTPGQRLPKVLVEGRTVDLVGTAGSASQGIVTAERLDDRPLLRPGEVLERVPGLIVTQHSGAGKANQFFLRGFNLDHGTDFATTVAGVPVNLPSHGHGQGYTDLNFLIPELIRDLEFRKGPYDARDGDFASAGSLRIEYIDRLEQGLARVEAGSFGFARAVLGESFAAGPGEFLFAVEVFHEDGPWVNPDDYDKRNGVLRYSTGDDRNGLTLTAMGYGGEWNATDQIARRAVGAGGLTRFGTLDTTTGGDSERYSLAADWHETEGGVATKVVGYAFHYDLDLFSNFTYFRDDPVNGDQFEQTDRRSVVGLDAARTWKDAGADSGVENTLGLQVRSDFIDNSLRRTRARERLTTVRADDVVETSLGVYGENRTRWTKGFRTIAGLRGDAFLVDVDSDSPVNSGHRDDAMLSPKLSMIFGPWADTELYVNGGLGYHSNDARGAETLRDDPTTPVPDDGQRVPLLVRSKGAEVGVRTTAVSGLHTSAAFWVLDLDSEFVFVGDAGNTEASRPSRRMGIEWMADYSPLPWLTVDVDAALSRARFRDDAPEGDRIPGAIEQVLVAGVTASHGSGLTAGLRLRHFGERPLTEDDSVRSSSTTLVDGRIGYRIRERMEIALDAFNLFDQKASDIEYYYPSRLAGEPAGPDEGGYNDIHFHPVEPFSVRFSMTVRF